MDDMNRYPHECRGNIRKLSLMLSSDPGTVYRSMLTVAALMDLRPEDNRVVESILMDYGMDGTEIA